MDSPVLAGLRTRLSRLLPRPTGRPVLEPSLVHNAASIPKSAVDMCPGEAPRAVALPVGRRRQEYPVKGLGILGFRV